MSRLASLTLLPVLALVAMAGPVAGEDGSDLFVRSLSYEGPATQDGLLAMLFLQEAPLEGVETAKPWIAAQAAHVRAVSYTGRYVEASGGDLVPLAQSSPSQPEDPVEYGFDLAELRLSAFQETYQVHVFATEGLLPYAGVATGMTVDAVASARMASGSFGNDDLYTDTTPNDLESNGFATVVRDGPFAAHRDAGKQTEVTVRGDLVLEIFGITLGVTSPDGEGLLASGVWRSPVADGLPKEPVANVQETFVRVFLEDAELTVATDGGLPRFEWVSTDVQLAPSGPTTLFNSYGRLGDTELRDQRHVLAAGTALFLQPQAEGLAVDVSESDFAPRGTVADVPAPASAALVGAGAILALGIAVTIGLLRRVLHRPQLAEVERAIEEGQYRKAARMAARILSRRPRDESALLARGIALTKSGDNATAAREIQAHLDRAPATDGSLHYVLGLAQLDLGQKDQGRASLREAVRLTPALQPEVAPRLGKAFSTPAPTTRESSGYA